MFVMDERAGRMVEQEVEFVPALYKIFDEILVNAADNKQRDNTMKEIRVKIDLGRGTRSTLSSLSLPLLSPFDPLTLYTVCCSIHN